METMRVLVQRITFHNEENGYTVLKGRVKNRPDLLTVVGNFAQPHAGSVLTVRGEWRIDGKYGQQFCAESYEESLPATALGMERYLGSGLIRGVGPSIARRIVRYFGDQTLEIMDQSPERLLEVPGIGKRKILQIQQSWLEQKEIKNIMIFLQSHDVSTAHAARIYKQYGNQALQVLRENPYRMADDIYGIGFRTADQIARKLGMDPEAFFRIRSGLIYALGQLSSQGHCFAIRPELLKEGTKLLNVAEEKLVMTLDQMVRDRDLIVEKKAVAMKEDAYGYTPEKEDAIYLPPFFISENAIARKLIRLMNMAPSRSVPDMEEVIRRVSAQTGIVFDPVQMEAIRTAVKSKVMVLTGGPGTGKTTTTQSIIAVFRMSGMDVVLAAPTGRAAKRMTESCSGTFAGLESRTIHRLLEYNPASGYQRNDENPLSGHVLIVDECSMIDTLLMHNLLKAVPDDMRLILIGDADQLPSVGAGNVLRDLIASETVPVVRLQRIFRQAQNSLIVRNAHRVNQGSSLEINHSSESDFFRIQCEEPADAVQRIADLYCRRLPQAYHVNPVQDIQVLSPRNGGPCGALALNARLQALVNPTAPGLTYGGMTFRAGDKVMQIRNNYDKEVFNGDIGFIRSVDTEERTLQISFDGGIVSYDATELDELNLAYACTIHKAQGSEYPIVIMPILRCHFPLLQRNLLYTGITRARKRLILVGDPSAVAMCVNRADVDQRMTLLAQRLKRLLTC